MLITGSRPCRCSNTDWPQLQTERRERMKKKVEKEERRRMGGGKKMKRKDGYTSALVGFEKVKTVPSGLRADGCDCFVSQELLLRPRQG